MKLMALMAVQPGMIVAENIYSFDNKLLVHKNTVLESMHLKKLNAYSIGYLKNFRSLKEFTKTI